MLGRIKTKLDDVSLGKKGLAVVSIPLAVLVFTLLLTAWYEKESRDSQDRVSHSLLVKAELYQIQTLVTDSETAVRGYLLWDLPVYLNPYNEALTNVLNTGDTLKDLVKDNAEQTSRAVRLIEAATVKMRTLKQILQAPAAALKVDNELTIRSRNTMSIIRQMVAEMDTTENYLLAERKRVHEDILHQINVSLVVLFVLAVLAGLSASYIVSSSILRRLNNLEHYARHVSRGQPAEWNDRGNDELGQLGRSVQLMTQNLLSREDSLRHARLQLEEANTNLQHMLTETRTANQELESFSYSVSHDLRAPLRHVAGFSELLLRNSENMEAKNKRYLDIISTSIKQMGVLIDELLAFSRMGRTSLKSDPVNLTEVLNDVLHDLSHEITERAVEWNVGDLPTVKGDKVMIQLVFQNLISNALKYTRKRNPAKIEILSEDLPESGMVLIKFVDNGVGFDMSYVDKLFGVFQRLHSSDDFEGTGIGLATVRRIVQRHGGQVTAESQVEHGATFTITLPAYTEVV